MSQPTKSQQQNLLAWYKNNSRPLPWRKTQDPYKIWISESMLQQTTSKAVVPFYQRFIKKFPTLNSLSKATIEEVYELWSGLGYYSRARNLLKAAQLLANETTFPRSYKTLLPLPGFGPYTARAVASIAFNESVGVVDGNTIRFLSRYKNKPYKWWSSQERREIQNQLDVWCKDVSSREMNQALMELGATVCLPKNPQCFHCPLVSSCKGHISGHKALLPLKKPKKSKEIWVWQVHVPIYKSRYGFIENNYAPFLRKQKLFPGISKELKKAPKSFDFKHMITHHEIYVQVTYTKENRPLKKYNWIRAQDVSKQMPATLIKKTIQAVEERLK